MQHILKISIVHLYKFCASGNYLFDWYPHVSLAKKSEDEEVWKVEVSLNVSARLPPSSICIFYLESDLSPATKSRNNTARLCEISKTSIGTTVNCGNNLLYA